MNLEELKVAILEDGVVDKEEVDQLRTVLYDDGIIDQEEADFMFDLNDAVTGKDNHASWEELFVKVICDFLLEDEESPGEIDETEAAWLVEKIGGDGQVDDLEKKLLASLKEKAKSFPSSLANMM